VLVPGVTSNLVWNKDGGLEPAVQVPQCIK
jgi:hypothetical protein